MGQKISFCDVDAAVAWEKIMGPYKNLFPVVVDGEMVVTLWDKRHPRYDKCEVAIDACEIEIDTFGAPTKPIYQLPEDAIKANLCALFPGLEKITYDVGGTTMPSCKWTLTFMFIDGICDGFGCKMSFTEAE